MEIIRGGESSLTNRMNAFLQLHRIRMMHKRIFACDMSFFHNDGNEYGWSSASYP
jgi:hypothetical protein